MFHWRNVKPALIELTSDNHWRNVKPALIELTSDKITAIMSPKWRLNS